MDPWIALGIIAKRDFRWTLKKLTQAARHWARQLFSEAREARREKLEQQANRMRQQKAPESLIKKILEQLDDVQTFEVWPENHIAVIIFLKLQTQWERNPLDNSMQSLKWGSVEIAMRREPGAKKLAEEEQDQLFSDITTMERHALSEIAKIKAENK